jgi:hypothetical protein
MRGKTGSAGRRGSGCAKIIPQKLLILSLILSRFRLRRTCLSGAVYPCKGSRASDHCSAAPRKKPTSWPRCCPSGTIRSGSRSGPTRGARPARRSSTSKARATGSWRSSSASASTCASRSSRSRTTCRSRSGARATRLAAARASPRSRACSRTGTRARISARRRSSRRTPKARCARRRSPSSPCGSARRSIATGSRSRRCASCRRPGCSSSCEAARGRRPRDRPEVLVRAGADVDGGQPFRVRRHAQPARPAVAVRRGGGIHSGVWDTTEGFFTESTRTASGSPRRRCATARGASTNCLTTNKSGTAGARARSRRAACPASTRRSSKTRSALRRGLRLRARRDRRPAAAHVRGPVHPVGRRARGARQRAPATTARRSSSASTRRRAEDVVAFRQGRNARDCCGSATHGHWLGKDNVQIATSRRRARREVQARLHLHRLRHGHRRHRHPEAQALTAACIEVKFGDTAHDKDSEFATHAAELWARVRDWLPGGMVEKDDGEKGTLSSS